MMAPYGPSELRVSDTHTVVERQYLDNLRAEIRSLRAELDALKPKPQPVAWVNVYPADRSPGLHLDKQSADSRAEIGRIACIPITQELIDAHRVDGGKHD